MSTKEVDPQAQVEEARRRYWFDAEFSARVKMAVSVAESVGMFDGPDVEPVNRQALVTGAAIALHLEEQGLLQIPGTAPRQLADGSCACCIERAAR